MGRILLQMYLKLNIPAGLNQVYSKRNMLTWAPTLWLVSLWNSTIMLSRMAYSCFMRRFTLWLCGMSEKHGLGNCLILKAFNFVGWKRLIADLFFLEYTEASLYFKFPFMCLSRAPYCTAVCCRGVEPKVWKVGWDTHYKPYQLCLSLFIFNTNMSGKIKYDL